MKASEIFEGMLPNKHRVFDIINDDTILPREIRQTYIKCYKNKLRSPLKKRATLLWAEFMLLTPRNQELKDMLNFIIEYCKK
jgi:hypothetical protein